MMSAELFALAEVGFGMTGPIWFLADHWIQRAWLKRHQLPNIFEVTTGELPRISILLCVRNEAQIIEGKLADLARQVRGVDRGLEPARSDVPQRLRDIRATGTIAPRPGVVERLAPRPA